MTVSTPSGMLRFPVHVGGGDCPARKMGALSTTPQVAMTAPSNTQIGTVHVSILRERHPVCRATFRVIGEIPSNRAPILPSSLSAALDVSLDA